MNNTSINNIFFFCTLILLGVLSRIIPHPDNFTAIGAVALFAGAYSRKRNLHFLIPLIAIFISNILLIFVQNKPLPTLPIQMAIYACFLLYTPIGSFLIKQIKIKNIALGGLCGASIFFIVTNFMVWLGGGYSYTAGGLITCYTAAIPFYLKMLSGDLVWSLVLFGAYELSTNLYQKQTSQSF